uniref:SRR1 domain-containing protein n=1 Tax=Strongyloides papillosus TaxID=174720 RepID=A0A0N5BDD7_STREA
MDSDGFVIVAKRRSCKPKLKIDEMNFIYPCTIEISFKRTNENVCRAINQLTKDKYINMFLTLLEKILNGDRISKIKCYGIGHFGELDGSGTYQLALLILIQKHYNISVTIQEPILNDVEINYINNYPFFEYISGDDLTSIEISESQNDYVLFFIPHGEDEMYEGILKTHNNEKQRQKMIILGNVLDDISITYKNISNFKYWKEYYDVCKKHILPTYSKCMGAFNNTCLMYN